MTYKDLLEFALFIPPGDHDTARSWLKEVAVTLAEEKLNDHQRRYLYRQRKRWIERAAGRDARWEIYGCRAGAIPKPPSVRDVAAGVVESVATAEFWQAQPQTKDAAVEDAFAAAFKEPTHVSVGCADPLGDHTGDPDGVLHDHVDDRDRRPAVPGARDVPVVAAEPVKPAVSKLAGILGKYR